MHPVHDPCVIKHEDTFFLFGTSAPFQSRGIPVRTSSDLFHWAIQEGILHPYADWVIVRNPSDQNLWAPDITRWDGRYWLYYSVGDFGQIKAAIGLATNTTLDCADADYSWVDQGTVLVTENDQDDWHAIDPCVALDSNGLPWLFAGSGRAGIKCTQLNRKTGKPTKTPPLLTVVARRPEGGVIEAPYVVRHGDFYYLFVSYDFCCRGLNSDYKVKVGRSRSITGPYLDFAGKDMREGAGTLVIQSHDNIIGPGHNAVIEDKGNHWFVHHFYDGGNVGRPTMQIRPLFWLPTGWPVVGEPISGPVDSRLKTTSQKKGFVGSWNHRVNYEAVSTINMQPDGSVRDANAVWRAQGNIATIRWRLADGDWSDTCILAEDGMSYVGRNQVGDIVSGVRQSDGASDNDAGQTENKARQPTGVPSDAVSWNGHQYAFLKQQASLKDAVAKAKEMAGHLVVIDDAEENRFVSGRLQGISWLGVRREPPRRWVGAAGKRQQFFNWEKGQPSGSAGEDGIAIWPSGVWHDHFINEKRFIVVEWEQ